MDSVISEDVLVLIRKDTVCRPVRLKRGRKVNVDKLSFFPDNALGKPYGSSYEVRANQLLPKASEGAKTELSEDAAGVDNRGLSCDGSAQKLTEQDIAQMKAEGCTGQAIVESVIGNSKSFAEKTIFAQEKYIKKKERRHVAVVTFMKPSTKLLCEMYYDRAPSRTCHLRLDTIAQILTQVNAHAYSKLLLVETCQGLLAGALLERMGGFGELIQVFFGDSPARQVPLSFLDNFGHLSDRDLSPLMMYPLHKVGTLLDPSVIEGSVAVQTLLKQRESPDLTLCGEEDLVTETSESCEQPKESCVKRLDSDKSPFPSDKSPTPAEEGPPHSTESPPHLLEDRSSSLPRAKKLKEDGKLAGAGVVVESDVEAMLTGAGVVVESDVEAMLTGAGVVVESDVEAMLTGTGVVVESDVEAMLTGAGTHITHPITQSAEAGAQIAKETKRRLRDEQYLKAEDILKQKQMDGLVVASRFHPEPILMALIHFIAPSRPFVVYCPALEPLVSCFSSLKCANCAFNIQLFETWTRKYQVLPYRTHPEMSMDGQSGYILVGTTVTKKMVPT